MTSSEKKQPLSNWPSRVEKNALELLMAAVMAKIKSETTEAEWPFAHPLFPESEGKPVPSSYSLILLAPTYFQAYRRLC